MPGLWVMGGADDVATKVMPEDLCVLTLDARRHRLADERKGLVAVEAMKLDDLSVEREALWGEGGLAEADAAAVFVDDSAVLEELNVNGVKVRGFKIPQIELAQFIERESVGAGDRGGERKRAQGLVSIGLVVIDGRGFGDLAGGRGADVAVWVAAEFGAERKCSETRIGSAVEEAFDLDGGGGAEHVGWAGADVFEKGLGDDAERDLAIDAAEGEVVDLVAEGRDVGAFGGVDVEGEKIFAGGVEMLGQLEGKRRVASAVFAELRAVEVDGGCGHNAFEVDEDAPSVSGGDVERATVKRDELIGLVVKAVPGQANVSVRDDDAGKAGVVEAGIVTFA